MVPVLHLPRATPMEQVSVAGMPAWWARLTSLWSHLPAYFPLFAHFTLPFPCFVHSFIPPRKFALFPTYSPHARLPTCDLWLLCPVWSLITVSNYLPFSSCGVFQGILISELDRGFLLYTLRTKESAWKIIIIHFKDEAIFHISVPRFRFFLIGHAPPCSKAGVSDPLRSLSVFN